MERFREVQRTAQGYNTKPQKLNKPKKQIDSKKAKSVSIHQTTQQIQQEEGILQTRSKTPLPEQASMLQEKTMEMSSEPMQTPYWQLAQPPQSTNDVEAPFPHLGSTNRMHDFPSQPEPPTIYEPTLQEQIKQKSIEILETQDVDAWSQWRQANQDIRPDLSDADLHGLDLRGFDLKGSILTNANLRDTKLQGADLREADLSDATLVKTVFRGADMRHAKLIRANMTDADLSEAFLQDVDLTQAVSSKKTNLTGADLTDATLTGANLRGAILKEANLTNATLTGADLSGAMLNEAILTNARLTKANLLGADLSQAFLINAILTECILSRAILVEAVMVKADLSKAYLNSANMQGVDLSSAKLIDAYCRGADLSKASLKKANLTNADLSETHLHDVDLTQAVSKQTNLTEADLTEATLTGANLRGAILTRTMFNATILVGANFNKASLNQTIFENVNLSETKGLETVNHLKPSVIDIDTIDKSRSKISIEFLRQAGTPDIIINSMFALAGHPIKYQTCFISYSSKDKDFAQRLYSDLKCLGVHCDLDTESLRSGERFRDRLAKFIQNDDKLLLIFSEHSLESLWVKNETTIALHKKDQFQNNVLLPFRIDDSVLTTDQVWAEKIRDEYHIGDFMNWQQPGAYQIALDHLLRALKDDS
jgi:uncharacterized protein YjbI with pentapeptide repeats